MFVLLVSIASCGVLSDKFNAAGKQIASTKYVDGKIREALGSANVSVEIPAGNKFADPDGLVFSGYFVVNGDSGSTRHDFADIAYKKGESCIVSEKYVLAADSDEVMRVCDKDSTSTCYETTFTSAHRPCGYATEAYVDTRDGELISELLKVVVDN